MGRATQAILLAATFGGLCQYLFYRESLGINALVATGLFLAIAWRLRSARAVPIDLWMPGFAVVFAAFIAIRTDAAVVAFDVLAVLALSLATTASLRGVAVTPAPFALLLAEALRTPADAFWRAGQLLAAGARPLALSAPVVGRMLPYLAGVALALPFIAIFVSLFRSADVVFARTWDHLLDVTRWWAWLGEAKDRALVGVVSAWLAAGAFADRGAAHGVSAKVSARSAVLTAFLGALAALFAAFVFIQIAYLFARGDTLAAASLSYSDYARRGFFELFFVAALVAGILFVAELVVDRATRAYLAGAFALLVLTGIVVASSAYRMDLYQSAYGWTELRVYALAAIAAVAAALAILAWSLAARRTRYAAQPIAIVSFGIALAVNALGPSDLLARANIERAPTEEVRRPDLWYLTSLGPGALPRLVAARDVLPEADRRCLDFALIQRYRAGIPQASSWQSWNLDRERARDALEWLEANVFPSVDPRDPSVCRL
jgi:hypothetical protein